nr:hypothetical protein [Tanacetum cinerariifolium]
TEPSAPETPTPPLPPPPPPPTTGHHMTTRSKAGVFKPVHKPDFVPSQRHGLCAALFAASDLRSYKAAAKQWEWVMAIRKEIEHQTEPSAPETPTPPPPPPTTGHHMTTRSKAGVFKPVHKPNFVPSQRHGLCAALFAASDP